MATSSQTCPLPRSLRYQTDVPRQTPFSSRPRRLRAPHAMILSSAAGPDAGSAPHGGPFLKRLIPVVFLTLWLIALLDLTLFAYPQRHPAPNLVPFRSILRDGRLSSDEFTINFLGNLAAFVPLGLLLPFLQRRPASLRSTIATAALLSVSIEVAQYLSQRRVADIDDVILNALGRRDRLCDLPTSAPGRRDRAIDSLPGTRILRTPGQTAAIVSTDLRRRRRTQPSSLWILFESGRDRTRTCSTSPPAARFSRRRIPLSPNEANSPGNRFPERSQFGRKRSGGWGRRGWAADAPEPTGIRCAGGGVGRLRPSHPWCTAEINPREEARSALNPFPRTKPAPHTKRTRWLSGELRVSLTAQRVSPNEARSPRKSLLQKW